MMKLLFSLVAILFVCSSVAQPIYYPDSNWETRKPAELQMNQSIIDSAVRFALK